MLATAKEKVAGFLVFAFGRRQVRRGAAALLFFLLITALLSIEFVPHRVKLKPGQVSTEDIYAPRSIVFEDKAKTDQLRQEAAAKVPNQYDRDTQVTLNVQRDISNLVTEIGKILEDTSAPEENRLARLRQVLPFSLSEETQSAVLKASSRNLQELVQSINSLVAQALDSEQGVTPENLAEAKKNLTDKFSQMGFSKPYDELGR
ncbi:MAG: phosphohydrolase, partial [Desulfotomaculales bacterium]